MVGEGAEAFAAEQRAAAMGTPGYDGLAEVSNDMFVLPERREQLRQMQEARRRSGAASPEGPAPFGPAWAPDPYGVVDQTYGTVGAVALDADGHLAAGTSRRGPRRAG